jgi:hypothetical protein
MWIVDVKMKLMLCWIGLAFHDMHDHDLCPLCLVIDGCTCPLPRPRTPVSTISTIWSEYPLHVLYTDKSTYLPDPTYSPMLALCIPKH